MARRKVSGEPPRPSGAMVAGSVSAPVVSYDAQAMASGVEMRGEARPYGRETNHATVKLALMAVKGVSTMEQITSRHQMHVSQIIKCVLPVGLYTFGAVAKWNQHFGWWSMCSSQAWTVKRAVRPRGDGRRGREFCRRVPTVGDKVAELATAVVSAKWLVDHLAGAASSIASVCWLTGPLAARWIVSL